MQNKNAKKNLLSHSEAKVRLLGEYLKRYLNIISNDGYTERIKIYDLFCGEGVYDNNGEGSPLVILRAVKDMHFINVARSEKFPKIDCQFNDLDETKVDKVKKIVSEKSLYYSQFGALEYTSNNYEDEIKRIIQLPKSKKSKAFIFIDPYGYRNIKASDIKNLLQKKDSEVLLFLPTQFMYRFDTNGTPEALIDFIEELTDYKSWKETDPNSVWKYINQLKESFRTFLGPSYFVDTFTIKKDPSTVFCLFFFSCHIKGFEKMLEAKWEIDTEQGKGWTFTNNQPSLFELQKTNSLEEKLKFFLRSKRSNGEIYEFTLRLGFLTKHTNEIFFNWQKNGNLEVSSSEGRKIRKGAFYISYRYYKDEPKKAEFNLLNHHG